MENDPQAWRTAVDRLSAKIDDIRSIVQDLAVKVAEELAELRVQHDVIGQALQTMQQVGSNQTMLQVLQNKIKHLERAGFFLGTMLLGQWGAIIALWRALPP